MNFTNLAKSRYSCRKYTQEKPSEDMLMELIGTARLAPSAVNFQPWKFIIVDDPEVLTALKSTYAKSWLESAPVVIAACGDHGSAWKRDDGKIHTDVDVAIAIDHLTLSATDRGLGTCWICKFDAKKAAEVLSVPNPWEVIALIPVGFPAKEANMERHDHLRKPLDEIVSKNGF